MYVYFPNRWFGDDKIARVTGVIGAAGDLVFLDDELAVVLGETCAFPELVQGHMTAVQTRIVIKTFFSAITLSLLHTCVQERYSTYAQSVPLWSGSDLTSLQKRLKKNPQPVIRTWQATMDETGTIAFSSCAGTSKQQVLVFPDIWTMHQQLPDRLFHQPGVARWHSGLSDGQKASIFRGCKQGSIHTLLTTPAGIFQDRQDLGKIFLFDSHKRWYKNGHDPRYWTPSRVTIMQQHYQCELFVSGYNLSSFSP